MSTVGLKSWVTVARDAVKRILGGALRKVNLLYLSSSGEQQCYP